MIETEIAAMLAGNEVITNVVGNRILDMDFRASEWENSVNYLGDPVAIMDQWGFISPTVVVDGQGVNRSLNLRGAGRFMQVVNIWVFTPRGVNGMLSNRSVHKEITRFLHENTVPSRPMMMLQSVVGPVDDGDNLFTRIEFRVTFIPQEQETIP